MHKHVVVVQLNCLEYQQYFESIISNKSNGAEKFIDTLPINFIQTHPNALNKHVFCSYDS